MTVVKRVPLCVNTFLASYHDSIAHTDVWIISRRKLRVVITGEIMALAKVTVGILGVYSFNHSALWTIHCDISLCCLSQYLSILTIF